MNLPESFENRSRKRKNSPKKYCNTEEMSFYGATRTENSDTETEGYGEEYKQLHKYIKPRRMSIYAPDFRYGPNRRSYWQQDLSNTDDDDDDEDEEKKVDGKYKKENDEEDSSDDESSSEDSGDEHEEKDDDAEDIEKAEKDKMEMANGDKACDWEKAINLQKIQDMMQAKQKVATDE
ncbi:hypothetical protein B9Z55_022565 [Caenorhabditis nigoni]|uniref:Uncharacterized protein n=1 Tax=Caenorhabditis nigoni TaxID=1611254 RepID=A0A2G5SLD2_9PELO|nr:hypothetical protein B9Z55_022565 [Caenorhabditis nigoni]